VNVVVDLVGYMIPVSEVTGLAGNKFLVGDGAPSAGTGAIGDTYFDTASKDLYSPKTSGGWGSPVANLGGGQDGQDGADGSSFLSWLGCSFRCASARTATPTSTRERHRLQANRRFVVVDRLVEGPEGRRRDQRHQRDQRQRRRVVPHRFGRSVGCARQNGDTYVDTSTGGCVQRAGGSWSSTGTSLKGPKGDKGDKGDAGHRRHQRLVVPHRTTPPTGADGKDGDSWVDVNTGIVYHRTSGTWSPIGAVPEGSEGRQGRQGRRGNSGAPGPGAEVGTTTPTGACSPNGLLHVNINTGEIVVCVSGTWSGAVAVRNTIDGATSYADSGVAPVFTDLDGTFRTVATFTAPVPGGTTSSTATPPWARTRCWR